MLQDEHGEKRDSTLGGPAWACFKDLKRRKPEVFDTLQTIAEQLIRYAAGGQPPQITSHEFARQWIIKLPNNLQAELSPFVGNGITGPAFGGMFLWYVLAEWPFDWWKVREEKIPGRKFRVKKYTKLN